MRFHIGAPPQDENFLPDEEGWTPLREPTPLMVNVLAVPFGVFAAAALDFAWGRAAVVLLEAEGSTLGRWLFAAGLLVILAVSLLVVVALHELVHGVAYPRFGLGRRTIIAFWPSRFLFYAAYLNAMPRNRWIFAYLAPFLVLSLVPLLIYQLGSVETARVDLVTMAQDLFQGALKEAEITIPAALYLVSVVNGLFCGGDLLYVALFLLQVPRRALMRNAGWSTWWKE